VEGYGDWLVSVDDHVIEPPHVWQTYVPASLRDRAPKVVRDDADGFWKWDYDGRRNVISGLSAVAGFPSDQWDPMPMDLSSPPSPSYNDPAERLKAMDQDHVIASLLFPTYGRFCGQTFLEGADKDLGLACIRAYNDWMLDEWCATAPDRYIPLCLVPMWDGELAATEARRVAAKGARSISFSENPSMLGLPSLHDRNRYWDPLFRACIETGMPLSIHLGSSSQIRTASPDAPLIEGASFMAMGAHDTVIDWIWSGNLIRYPELKVVLSESGVAWVPALIERMRRDQHRWRWARSATTEFQGDILTGDPRDRGERSPFGDIPDGFDPLDAYRQSIFPCVVADDYGWDALDYLGADNVMIETDYPHGDSAFPHSAKIAAENLAHLADDVRNKLLRENACRVYRFTPAPASSLPIG
jgi:predicted TIM-barrel fold metal-dependent hydrolase